MGIKISKKILLNSGLVITAFFLLLGQISTFVPGAEESFYILPAILAIIIFLVSVVLAEHKFICYAAISLFILSLFGIYTGYKKGVDYANFAAQSAISSPSGKFQIKTSINQDKSDPTRYLCVKIYLLDTKGNELAQLQTGASDRMKWATGWMKEQDIIVLDSSDIGTHAWEIKANNDIKEIKIDNEIIGRGDELKASKYH